MKKHLRGKLKKQIIKKDYNSIITNKFFSFYGMYIQFIKEESFNNSEIQIIIKNAQKRLNNYLIKQIEKNPNFKEEFSFFLNIFVSQFSVSILKLKNFLEKNYIFLEKNMIQETKVLLVILYKRFNFLHPNNKTFYEKILKEKENAQTI